jgi:hypothetical protein
MVVRCEPHTDFAFRIRENWTIWSFALEPTAAGGTRLTQRRETPKGISGLSLRLTKVALGGVPKFTGELEALVEPPLGEVLLQREVAGVEEVQLGVGDVVGDVRLVRRAGRR